MTPLSAHRFQSKYKGSAREQKRESDGALGVIASWLENAPEFPPHLAFLGLARKCTSLLEGSSKYLHKQLVIDHKLRSKMCTVLTYTISE